jgi:hypothetical protein
MTAGSNGESLH